MLDPALFDGWPLPDDGQVIRFTTKAGGTGEGTVTLVWLAEDTPCINVDCGNRGQWHVFPELGDTWVTVRQSPRRSSAI